jgi:hypothetical protein
MKSVTEKKLAKIYNLELKGPLYRKDGTWFHKLKQFPTALMDENGYIKFETESELDLFFSMNERDVLWSKEKNWISVKNGIYSLENYKFYPDKIPQPQVDDLDIEIIEGAVSDSSVASYERDSRA